MQTHTQGRLNALVESPRAERVILTLIVINAVILGLETAPQLVAQYGEGLKIADRLLLGVFVAELLAKMWLHRGRFFRDPWRVFDLIVVSIALVPASGPFAVLRALRVLRVLRLITKRALRVLRVLRLITMVPAMRRVVGGLLGAIPGLGAIIAIMGLLFYVASVIATKLFGGDFPEWFGTLSRSAYTLFQIMTLESWSMGIVRPVMERFPYAWLFFVPYILIATFTMLNLFVAVIVSAMQSEAPAPAERVPDSAHSDRILEELSGMRREIAALHEALSRPTASTPEERVSAE